MKFGIVLPSYIYNDERYNLAQAAFLSLKNTEKPSNCARLLCVLHGNRNPQTNWVKLCSPFMAEIIKQPNGVTGTESTLSYGTDWLFDKFPEITHVVWMGDDALFHPNWLIELEALINRHPNASSWSVYRSAHVAFHATIREKGSDVLVKSICGHGMTFTREEWKALDLKSEVNWARPESDIGPAGDTIDLFHAWKRPGERWVTKRSYIQHTGVRGIHCNPGIPEYGIGFGFA